MLIQLQKETEKLNKLMDKRNDFYKCKFDTINAKNTDKVITVHKNHVDINGIIKGVALLGYLNSYEHQGAIFYGGYINATKNNILIKCDIDRTKVEWLDKKVDSLVNDVLDSL